MTLVKEVLASPETLYAVYKQSLIEFTRQTLLANGIQPDFRINDAEAKKCFESGMSPEQTFREQYKTA